MARTERRWVSQALALFLPQCCGTKMTNARMRKFPMNHVAPKHIVAACALVTNAGGEILLVKTERRGWELPGGQVEEGETLTQAAIRETQEEAGVKITIGELGVVNSNLSRFIVVFGFRGHYVAGHPAASHETVDTQ